MFYSYSRFDLKKLVIASSFMVGVFSATLDVRLQGDVEGPFGSLGSTFLITYQIDQFPSPAYWGSGFSAMNVSATLQSGSTNTTEIAEAGYFAYGDGYSGIDVRFLGLDLQFILVFPLFESAYLPPDSAPKILATKKHPLLGAVYSLSGGSAVAASVLSNGLYEARLTGGGGPEVPEPATAATLAAGILGLSLLRLRSRRTPVR